jgi:hypothetical protein
VVHVGCKMALLRTALCSRSALKALAQIVTMRQLRDGQSKTSDWLFRHNNVELAVQKTDAAEVDSYATGAEP